MGPFLVRSRSVRSIPGLIFGQVCTVRASGQLRTRPRLAVTQTPPPPPTRSFLSTRGLDRPLILTPLLLCSPPPATNPSPARNAVLQMDGQGEARRQGRLIGARSICLHARTPGTARTSLLPDASDTRTTPSQCPRPTSICRTNGT